MKNGEKAGVDITILDRNSMQINYSTRHQIMFVYVLWRSRGFQAFPVVVQKNVYEINLINERGREGSQKF